MAFQITNVPQGVSLIEDPFSHLRTFILSNPNTYVHSHVSTPGKWDWST